MSATSRTRLLTWVRGFGRRPLEAAPRAEPQLAKLVDERGRNLLHLRCGVNPRRRGLLPEGGVETARVLLAAGIDVDREAFSEGAWKATVRAR